MLYFDSDRTLAINVKNRQIIFDKLFNRHMITNESIYCTLSSNIYTLSLKGWINIEGTTRAIVVEVKNT